MLLCIWRRNSGSRIKTIAYPVLVILATIAACIWCGCAKDYNVNPSISPQNPPLPRVPSILPMAKGNAWTYADTRYDSAGARSGLPDELNLDMMRVYGREGAVLVLLEPSSFQDTFEEYVYGYEWEQIGKGSLVAYRDIDVTVPGVYIIGEFDSDAAWMYLTARLWLAYPSTNGVAYALELPDTSDSTPVRMEIVSTSAKFYCPVGGNEHFSAARFYDCYLYKETWGDNASYYYYSSEVGAVGYMLYHKGVLRRTYILTSFTRDN